MSYNTLKTMNKRYPVKNLLLFTVAIFVFAMASCSKKNSPNPTTTTPVATPTKIGLYEADSGEYREVIVAVSKIGTKTLDDGLVFDTGSGGMVFDAQDLIPASMIGANGFVFSGDSTVVNGITITNQTSTLEYGADSATETTVYGNLAYAPVTIGDQDGTVSIKRLPFCLYYKATDASGVKLGAHYFDTFGVNQEYITFSGGGYITSPFSYYDPGNGLTRGFKMATLGDSEFSLEGTFVPDLVTVGLTADDLSSSSGFTMHTVNYYTGDGYVPIFPVTVKYNTKTIPTYALFDSGTSGYSYIEDTTATSPISQLAQNSKVSITTQAGFVYSYTVAPSQYLTYIENPNLTGGEFSIISIDYFLNNEYLMDFTGHKMGLKIN
jgi:hypothetical protein